MKINKPVDISTIDKEVKKDYFDRHTPFIFCGTSAKNGEKFKVTVKLGKEYKHPDDLDHFISKIELWNRETLLAKVDYLPGTFGNMPSHAEVDFYLVPTKSMKLTATAYCTKHGLWHSDEKVVSVVE